MIQTILFDLDDTLYDERQFVEAGFRAAASYIAQGYQLNSDKVYMLFLSALNKYGRGRIFDICLRQLNIYDEKIVPELVRVYRTHNSRMALFPEAESLLISLKEKGYRLGLITDGDVPTQKSKVRILDIEKWFDCLVFSSEYGIGRQKPDPFPYCKALEKLNRRPEESVYIGDNPYKDFISAKKIGITTIRLIRGRYKEIELGSEYEADYWISNLSEIEDILAEL